MTLNNTKNWYSNIADGWKQGRLKIAVKSVKNGIWGDEPQGNENDIECVRIADFNRKKAVVKEKVFTIRNIPSEKVNAYLLNKNDLLIEKSGGGEKQPVGYVVQYTLDRPAVYANFMAKIEVDTEKFYPTFLNYIFSTLYAVRANLKAFNQTTGIQNLDTKAYLEELITYPTIDLQMKISKYLDAQTEAIDALIDEKSELVVLLEEKRQAMITEAVTKGLIPNMKMKDSGLEWIGEIPEHWKKTRLDFISRVKARLGWKGLKAEEYVDEGYIFLSTPNLKGRNIDFENVNYITEERYLESPEIMLEVGDVLLAKDGSTLGITNVVRDLPNKTTVNSSIAVLRPRESIDSVYFYYYLTSTYIQDTINQIKDGMGVPHLFQADIKKFPIILPPLDEQKEISQYLDEETELLESTVTLVKQQILKLKDYRQSLIYEAVTGKIDLRDIETEQEVG